MKPSSRAALFFMFGSRGGKVAEEFSLPRVVVQIYAVPSQ